MDLFIFVRAAGYGLGTALHLALLGLIVRRQARRPGEGLLALLALALVVWNAANLALAGLDAVGGDAAGAGSSAATTGARALTDLVAHGAALFAPSLLVHMLAVQADLRRAPPPGALHRAARGLLFYAPPAAIGAAIALGRAPGAALGGWFIAALVGAAAHALVLGQRAERRADAHAGTARFYRYLGAILLASAALAGAVGLDVVRRGREAWVVEGALIALSVAPTAAMAYGVHRYYAIRPFLRRGALDVALGVGALGLLAEGLEEMAPLAARLGLAAPVAQAVLLFALALVFGPTRRLARALLGGVLDPAAAREAALLRGLARAFAEPGAALPSELSARVAATVREALALEQAGLAIAPAQGAGPVAAAPPAWVPWRALLDALAALPPRAVYRRAELPSVELSRALAEARVDHVRPLRAEGDPELLGALAIGLHQDGSAPGPDALAALERVKGPLAAAVGAARLVDRTLALEGRVREEERLKSLGQLAATVAHRVKNPLASIKAICQALAEDLGESDPRREDLAVVVGEVDILAKVVNQLLGFARRPPGELGPLDAGAIAREAIDLLRHQAEAEGRAVRLAIEDGVPLAEAEPGGLREAVLNLVENALQHAPAGSEVRVTVRAGAGSGAGPTGAGPAGTAGAVVEVIVEDDGPGVPAEARARLFEPFFTTRPAGTGLGLFVARRQALAWGGGLALDPSAPRGARFVLSLRAATL